MGIVGAVEDLLALPFGPHQSRAFEQPQVMVLPMSRRDIADYLGMTLESVSRVLSTLRDEHILSLMGANQREIVLHDRSKLAHAATSV